MVVLNLGIYECLPGAVAKVQLKLHRKYRSEQPGGVEVMVKRWGHTISDMNTKVCE